MIITLSLLYTMNYLHIIEFPTKDKEERQTCSYRKLTITRLTQLSYETCAKIFENNYVNQIFNSILHNYLRIFNASFPTLSKDISANSDIT
jgi:hypothetical protein